MVSSSVYSGLGALARPSAPSALPTATASPETATFSRSPGARTGGDAAVPGFAGAPFAGGTASATGASEPASAAAGTSSSGGLRLHAASTRRAAQAARRVGVMGGLGRGKVPDAQYIGAARAPAWASRGARAP